MKRGKRPARKAECERLAVETITKTMATSTTDDLIHLADIRRYRSWPGDSYTIVCTGATGYAASWKTADRTPTCMHCVAGIRKV